MILINIRLNNDNCFNQTSVKIIANRNSSLLSAFKFYFYLYSELQIFNNEKKTQSIAAPNRCNYIFCP